MAKRKKSKGLLTVSNILRFIAAALGIGAFFFMFGNQVKVTANLWIVSLNGELSFSDTFFSNGGSPLGFIGYLLLLFGGLTTLLLVFVQFKKNARVLANLLAAVILLSGAVLVFLTAVPIKSASLLAMPIIAGILGAVSTGLVVCAFLLEK